MSVLDYSWGRSQDTGAGPDAGPESGRPTCAVGSTDRYRIGR